MYLFLTIKIMINIFLSYSKSLCNLAQVLHYIDLFLSNRDLQKISFNFLKTKFLL